MIRKTRTEALEDWRAKKFGPRRVSTSADNDFIYELRKKALPRSLTPSEYEAAIQKIARDLGI